MNDSFKIHSLNYSYLNQQPLLKNINLELFPKQITAILGPSGVGKSTLLRIFMGIETGASGFIETKNLKTSLNHWNSSQNIFSIVPQVPHLLPWKTVTKNVELAMNHIPRNQKRAKSIELLTAIQLQDFADKYPEHLSQGQASRVSFARALATKAPVFLLDEPFAALDAVTRYLLQDWLVQYVCQANIAALLVTHDIREALKTAHHIIVLKGSPAQIIFEVKQNHLLNLNSEGDHFLKLENQIFELLK